MGAVGGSNCTGFGELHENVPPIYPVVALEETGGAIGICLLPRPSLRRWLKLPPEKANSVTPRGTH
jgi:hypothetical protein